MSAARGKWLLLVSLALGASPVIGAPPVVGSPGNFFCCTDASGKKICGDILPQACYGRAYRELGSNGQVIRSVEAPLTAEQRAQRAAEEAQRLREEEKRKEQNRKDQALLNTYASEQDVDVMRKRAEEDVLQAIRAAEKQITELRLQRKKFENEAEFYKKKTLPPDVRKGLADADSDIGVQEAFIADKKKELATVRARYDENKRRFIDLMTQRAPKR